MIHPEGDPERCENRRQVFDTFAKSWFKFKVIRLFPKKRMKATFLSNSVSTQTKHPKTCLRILQPTPRHAKTQFFDAFLESRMRLSTTTAGTHHSKVQGSIFVIETCSNRGKFAFRKSEFCMDFTCSVHVTEWSWVLVLVVLYYLSSLPTIMSTKAVQQIISRAKPIGMLYVTLKKNDKDAETTRICGVVTNRRKRQNKTDEPLFEVNIWGPFVLIVYSWAANPKKPAICGKRRTNSMSPPSCWTNGFTRSCSCHVF